MSAGRIERILNSGFRASFALTGGGSGALHALLATPGASRFAGDARIPYSPEALADFLGSPPEQAVSPETAGQLAEQAFRPVCDAEHPVGISCTAALQTDRKRRGDDRAFICIKTQENERIYALHFSMASRVEQETLLSDWLLRLTAQAVAVERMLMLPGAFNPLHRGHCRLLRAAAENTGLTGLFELSSMNVDKPDIPPEEVLRRAAAVRDVPVALTRAPRFTDKAQLFPKTTFVLGFDTALRLVESAQKNEWDLFREREIKFLVAGRLCGASSGEQKHRSDLFRTLEHLSLPSGSALFFEAVPEPLFREDVSSTQLRGKYRV